jgi:ankyrin repeat protein
MQDDDAMIALLAARGADVGAQLRSGTTCLHEAVRHKCMAALRALLLRGADPNASDKDGWSAVDMAETFAMPEALALLIGAAVGKQVDNSLQESEQRQQVES